MKNNHLAKSDHYIGVHHMSIIMGGSILTGLMFIGLALYFILRNKSNKSKENTTKQPSDRTIGIILLVGAFIYMGFFIGLYYLAKKYPSIASSWRIWWWI
jgi:formate/nitrite transporter FocA (FNT family)